MIDFISFLNKLNWIDQTTFQINEIRLYNLYMSLVFYMLFVLLVLYVGLIIYIRHKVSIQRFFGYKRI